MTAFPLAYTSLTVKDARTVVRDRPASDFEGSEVRSCSSNTNTLDDCRSFGPRTDEPHQFRN